MPLKRIRSALVCLVVVGAFGWSASVDAQTSAPDRPEYIEPRLYSAAEAVQRATAEPGRGVLGQFAFIVKGTGHDATRVFLNSEADYRDPAALTVVLPSALADALASQVGSPPERTLRGRTIVVDGVAHLTRIDLLAGGRPTGRYYFQVHIDLTDIDDIHVVPGAPALLTAP